MNYDDERIAVEKFLITRWSGTTQASVKVYVEAGKAVDPVLPYAEMSIINGDAEQKELGGIQDSVWNKVEGYLQFDIYTPLNSGTAAARKIADAISAVFRRQRTSYGNSGVLNFGMPNRRSLGQRDGKQWEAVRVPFYRNVKL